MAGSPQFPKTRTIDGQQSRVQDNIAQQLDPVARRVAATPIGGGALPQWLAPDLKADFTNFVGFAATGYHMDALGYTHGKGVVSSAAGVGANTLIYTLPMGYRSREQHAFAVPNGAGATALLVNALGEVRTNAAIVAGQAFGLEFCFLADG